MGNERHKMEGVWVSESYRGRCPVNRREYPILSYLFPTTEDYYQNNFDLSYHHYHTFIKNEGDLFNYVIGERLYIEISIVAKNLKKIK